MTSETALWADLDAALGRDVISAPTNVGANAIASTTTLIGAPASTTTIVVDSVQPTRYGTNEERRNHENLLCIARFNDAVCLQLYKMWHENPSLHWQMNAHGVASSSLGVGGGAGTTDHCEAGVCQTRSFQLRIFVARVSRDSERVSMERMIARADKTPHIYLSGEANEYARRANLLNARIGTQPYALHACVDELCLLDPDTRTATRNIYNRLHTETLDSPLIPKTIYFCLRHTRFHVCDQFCDQARTVRHGERVCALSSIVKSAADSVFTFGDGTSRAMGDGGDEGGGGGGNNIGQIDLNATTQEDIDDANVFGRGMADGVVALGNSRRRTAYAGATVLRERGSFTGTRGRRRGRGRGSVIGGAERAHRERVALANAVAQSSGDIDAPSAHELAAQFANAARNVANVQTNDSQQQQQQSVHAEASTSRQRKLRRAKRVKSTISNAAAQATLAVPYSFLQSLTSMQQQANGDSGEQALGAMIAPGAYDNTMNGRLAVPVGCEAWGENALVAEGAADSNGFVMISFNVRATIPFGERSARFTKEFLFDVLQEKCDRPMRLHRFRLPATLQVPTHTFFTAAELFEQYGERACAIFWRIFASHERAAIESAKTDTAQSKLRSAIDTYLTERKRKHTVPLIEDFVRIAHTTRDSACIYKSMVIDDALWRIVETYNALLIVEFYFGLISFAQRFGECFESDISEMIQKHFFFEHFVPAIISFMRNGLEINGIVVLPADPIIVHEYYPETATLKLLGVAEQTMTHLGSTIRSYISAARSANISMRRLEATQIEIQDLLALRVPTPDSPSPDDSVAFAEYAARQVVQLFVSKRAARLDSLGQ